MPHQQNLRIIHLPTGGTVRMDPEIYEQIKDALSMGTDREVGKFVGRNHETVTAVRNTEVAIKRAIERRAKEQ